MWDYKIELQVGTYEGLVLQLQNWGRRGYMYFGTLEVGINGLDKDQKVLMFGKFIE